MAEFDQRHQNVTTQYNADRIIIYNRQNVVTDDQFWSNRRQMLEKVRLIWIKGLLEPSLYQLSRIELGLETTPDAVERPFDLFVQRPQQPPQPLPTGTPISHIFDEAGKALLILGEPGAGKTTLLLELTRQLLDRAQQDEHHLIPVVFNLSSWAEHRVRLAEWLMDELNKRYDVPRTLAKSWVDAGLILPLLDGLDEVAADHREACVDTMNAFLSEHGLLPIVVCSRRADYEALTVRLRLPSAVLIQALSQPQVQNYIDQAGAALTGLRIALQDDATLGELLNTPLMLSIAVLAYKGRSANDIHSLNTVEEHRLQLFAAYTDAMFHRRAKATPYTREQTEYWLAWLARTMKRHDQSIFYLEWMQPDWLPGQSQQRLVTFVTAVITSVISGLAYYGVSFGMRLGRSDRLFLGLFFGLLGGLSVGIRSPLVGGLLFGLLFGLLGGEVFGEPARTPRYGLDLVLGWGLFSGVLGWLSVNLVGYSKEIKPIEKIWWSWSAARSKWMRNLLKRLLGGLLIGLFGVLSHELLAGAGWKLLAGRAGRGLRYVLKDGLDLGLLGGLLIGLLGGLKDGVTVGEIRTQVFPNEGTRRSVRNALISGLSYGLSLGLATVVLSQLLGWLIWGGRVGYGWENGLPIGLLGWLLGGLRFGGRASLQHFTLRLILWHNNLAPLHYVRFLDYATTRIFLRKLGGGYVFIHRMLLEYFAAMHQTPAEQQKMQP